MAVKRLNVCWVFLASKVTSWQSFCRLDPARTAHIRGADAVPMPSSRPQCSTSSGAAAASACSWSAAGLQAGERELQESKPGEQARRASQHHLPSCSAVLPVLVSCVRERLCVGYPSLVLLACVVFG